MYLVSQLQDYHQMYPASVRDGDWWKLLFQEGGNYPMSVVFIIVHLHAKLVFSVQVNCAFDLGSCILILNSSYVSFDV